MQQKQIGAATAATRKVNDPMLLGSGPLPLPSTKALSQALVASSGTAGRSTKLKVDTLRRVAAASEHVPSSLGSATPRRVQLLLLLLI